MERREIEKANRRWGYGPAKRDAGSISTGTQGPNGADETWRVYVLVCRNIFAT